MRKLLAAVFVAATVVTGAATAQETEMGHDLTMLETMVSREFTKLGIDDVDPMSLTLNQLARINSATSSGNYSGNGIRRQIEAVIRD